MQMMKDRTKKRAKSAPAIRPKATPQYNINNLPETILEDKQVISSELFVEICRVWLLRLHSCLLQNYCSMLVFNNLITLFNTFDKMQIYFNCHFVLFPQLIMNSNKTSWDLQKSKHAKILRIPRTVRQIKYYELLRLIVYIRHFY